MSCPTAPCGPGATMKSSAVVPCAANACDIADLTRSTVSGSPSTSRPLPFSCRAAQQIARGVHPGLGRALRAPDPGQLRVGLHAAAVVEELAVDRQLDALGAQPVGEPERERLGDDGARDPERLDGAHGHLLAELPVREARSA